MDFNIDFEGKEQPVDNKNQNGNTNQNENVEVNPQHDTTDLTGSPDAEDLSNTGVKENNEEKQEQNNVKPYLEAGTNIDFNGESYMVTDNGDIVDGEGKVLVENKNVEKWLKENNITEDTDDAENGIYNIAELQEALHFVPTTEQGDIVYENTKEGLINYINDVAEISAETATESALNSFYRDHPYIQDVINYYNIHGTLDGYGNIQDRTSVVLDRDNEEQMIYILRSAAKEFNNPAINDNYIQYLKETGHLYEEAKVQLEALQEHDRQEADRRRWIVEHDAEQRDLEYKQTCNDINDIVHNRKVFDYVLPEYITKEVDGQKYTYGLNDFYDYMTKNTVELEDGRKISQRDYDFSQLSREDKLENYILQSWLLYTGTGYNDLINMAERQTKVKTLKQKSNEIRSQRTIKVTSKPQKVDMNDILLV